MKNLSTSGKIAAVGLLVSAAMVWWRDTSWSADLADTLPLAAGIPLAVWLGAPWKCIAADRESCIPLILPLLAGLLFAIAWILPQITLLSVAWSAFAAYWMLRWCRPSANVVALLLVLLFSFPWLVMEWPEIGWSFRLSAAVATDGFFQLLQMPVLRHGTELQVLGEIIRIEPACAGWNLLQLTLLVGLSIGLHELSQPRRFWVFLLFLPVLAWLANYLRIVALSGLCLTCGVGTAEGLWHGLTGLAVIAGVVAMAKWLCHVIEPNNKIAIRRRVVV
jgi:exosortase/archaeosortase family protein